MTRRTRTTPARATRPTATTSRRDVTAPNGSDPDSDVVLATNREFIGGSRVVERQPATHQTPIADRPLPLTGVDEVLLENGNVVFQCVASDDCHHAFAKMESARAHLAKHSAKRVAARIKREDDEKRAARSDAARRAAATRATNRARSAASPPPAVEQLAARLTEIIDELAETFSAFTQLVLELRRVRDALERTPGVDPELLEKARRFDAIRGAFGD